MTAAHQVKLEEATTKSKPVNIPVGEIASVGHPLTAYSDVEKVNRMRRKLQRGKNLPPIRVTPLTPELRDRYGAEDPNKKFYLDNGHHRLAASKLEGMKTVRAVSFRDGKRI